MSNKDDRLRREGLAFAVKYLESHTPEELRAEAKRRGAYDIPMNLAPSVEQKFCNQVKSNMLDTVLIMSLATLRDEFDFGKVRLNRFKKRFNEKSECIGDDLASWDDYRKMLLDECGMDLKIRWVGGAPE